MDNTKLQNSFFRFEKNNTKLNICVRGEADITIVFETIIPSSILGGRTTKSLCIKKGWHSLNANNLAYCEIVSFRHIQRFLLVAVFFRNARLCLIFCTPKFFKNHCFIKQKRRKFPSFYFAEINLKMPKKTCLSRIYHAM